MSDTVLNPDVRLPRDLTRDSDFIRAVRGRATDRTPVWFMRQAGRSLPEYRRLREGVAMMEACTDAAMVAEITLQPVRRHGVDAAILFSDIVLPLHLAGVDLDIRPGVGPVVEEPFRSAADVGRIGELEDLSFLTEAIASITDELGDRPLIGFCGAPFTVASYLIEGGPSRDHALTKALMWERPQLWDDLLGRVADVCAQFLQTQVSAGVSAIQVFDSWAGALSREDYESRVLPHTVRILESVPEVPRINFGTGTGELLGVMAVPQCEVVGVDHRVALEDAIARIGPDHAVQGNLDPAALFAGEQVMQDMAASIVAQGRAAKGHVFNLGHGVLPGTDAEVISDLVAYVHSL